VGEDLLYFSAESYRITRGDTERGVAKDKGIIDHRGLQSIYYVEVDKTKYLCYTVIVVKI
jgi:hypothetical protein